MSDAGDKHFSATPSRIAKARRDGNIARSQELSANIAFAAAALCVVSVAPLVASLFRAAILAAVHRRDCGAELVTLLTLAIAVIGAGAAGGATASILQSGFVLLLPAPKLSRLQPVDGLKRMLSRETTTHAVRALAAFTLSSVAIVASMQAIVAGAVRGTTIAAIAAVTWNAAQHVVFAATGVGLLFAALEYGVARKAWLSKLKMTLHELKREMKEHDGDPMARARRKALHRNVIRGSLKKIKDASFVVVNPTHVAIALEYRPPQVPVPVVLIRAADEMAQRVRGAAVEAGVPIVEDIPLARALFARSDVGRPIAHEHYVAVAEVVARLVRGGVLK